MPTNGQRDEANSHFSQLRKLAHKRGGGGGKKTGKQILLMQGLEQ